MEHLPPALAFRRGRDGYDRADVDRYVNALLAEREELRNRVADLESTIEATTDYLQSRRGRRGQPAPVVMPAWQPPAVVVEPSPRRWVPAHPVLTMRAISSTRTIRWTGAAIAIVAIGVSMLAYRRARGVDPLAAANTVVAASGRPTAADWPGAMGAASIPAGIPVAADFVVALATPTTCWLAIGIDGQPRIERVLHRDEQFSVHGSQEILLRVGDAGAVTVKINGRPAKPLGPAGQPVTVRITPSNLEQFIAPAAAP